MIKLEETTEWQHQELERRPCRSPVHLVLEEFRHEIFLPDRLAAEDERYVIERASALRWIGGRGEMEVDHAEAKEVLERAFGPGGSHAFEARLFEEMHLPTGPEDRADSSGALTIFLDAGGSSLKGVLFSNEQLASQQSVAWEPFKMTMMNELIEAISDFLRHLLGSRDATSVHHVGVSSAGICEEGALLVTSLTQGMSFSKSEPYDPWFMKRLVGDLFPAATFMLMNDGSVAALPIRAGQKMRMQTLSLVMGSNLGGGHSQAAGIHEFGFVPFMSKNGVLDEWSGYHGIASAYFSKVGLLRLAKAHGYEVRDEREMIDQLHTDLRHGLRPARLVFQELGTGLAALVCFLERFLTVEDVSLSGGILTSMVVDAMRPHYETAYAKLSEQTSPALRMLVVPSVLPEYNQVWTLALNHFRQAS